MKQLKMDLKQQKIQQILAIVKGDLNPSDLPDRLIIVFEDDLEVKWLINDKPVSREAMHAKMNQSVLKYQSSVDPNFKTIGRADNMEEYYYG